MTKARLAANQYGKAEVRLVRVDRADSPHRLTDLNVSIALQGDLVEAHLSGDNTNVLPTDTQKNMVYAFARAGVGEIEDFGLRLGRHLVSEHPSITWAQVDIEQYGWNRIGPHSFSRAGDEIRTARVTVASGASERVSSGLKGLTVLSTTDSEFVGFIRDGYTTLPEANDRVLATVVEADWQHDAIPPAGGWGASFAAVRAALIEAFVDTYSRSLQETLYRMGERALARAAGVGEVRLRLPNKHHFVVDLAPFGLDNPNEIFVATDRPYGLIEGTVTRQ